MPFVRTRQLLVAAAMIMGVAQPGAAQIVRGVVVDSLTEQPLTGATVILLNAQGAELEQALTDPEGLFLFRAPRGGSYYLRVAADGFTESEFPEFLLAAEEVRGFMLLMGTADGSDPQPVDPSAAMGPPLDPGVAAFIERVCGVGVVDPGQPVLIGQVTDARTGEPVPDAEVVLLWSAIPEAIEAQVGYQPSTGAAMAGSTGHFAVCGAPVETRVLVHAQSQGRVSEFVSLRFAGNGVYVGDEYRPMDSPVFQYDLAVLAASQRTAAVLGSVTDSIGARLPSARVTVDGSTLEARTDLLGGFELTELPPGTLRYTVEQIGYRPYRGIVQVAADDTVQLSEPIQLARAPVALDPVRVEAEPPTRRRSLDEFERRRTSTNGQFLTREEWEQRGVVDETVDVLRRMRGIRIRPGPTAAQPWIITSGRGARTAGGGLQGGDCYPIIFLDRIYLGDTQSVDLDRAVPIQNLEAVEYYNATAGMPPEFNRPGAVCGVIALWTR